MLFSNKPLEGLAPSCDVALALKGCFYNSETKMPPENSSEMCCARRWCCFCTDLNINNQNIAVPISMMHIRLAPLGHFIKQVLKTPGNCKPVGNQWNSPALKGRFNS